MGTSSAEMRRIVDLYVEIHATGDTSKLAAIIDPEFRYRFGSPVGVEGVAAGVRALHAGFSEIACSVEQCVGEGEWVAFRFVIAGTHTGMFAGRGPTGRRITWSGADFVRLREGKLFELWNVSDSLPLMVGIGAVRKPNT
jgi:predicted ester cyclase